MKNARNALAWNIRRIRVRLNLSQEHLAADCRLDTSYVSRLERGLENPTIATLSRIADALGVTVTDLLAKPKGDRPAPLRGGRKPRK